MSHDAKQSAVRDKSFAFAVPIVKMSSHLQKSKNEFVLSKQVMRSGTTVGALVREVEQAESELDFVHKLAIALKEASETQYWLDLLHQSKLIDDKGCESINPEVIELIELLTSIIGTSKANNRN